jgi:hypothetical protein
MIDNEGIVNKTVRFRTPSVAKPDTFKRKIYGIVSNIAMVRSLLDDNKKKYPGEGIILWIVL